MTVPPVPSGCFGSTRASEESAAGFGAAGFAIAAATGLAGTAGAGETGVGGAAAGWGAGSEARNVFPHLPQRMARPWGPMRASSMRYRAWHLSQRTSMLRPLRRKPCPGPVCAGVVKSGSLSCPVVYCKGGYEWSRAFSGSCPKKAV